MVVAKYIQLADKIITDIKQRKLLMGEKMPSIRKLSEQQNISKNTVISCFRYLEQRGYLEARVKQGYFVINVDKTGSMPLPSFKGKPVQIQAITGNLSSTEKTPHPFERAQLTPALLSLEKLNKCLTSAVRRYANRVNIYGNFQGELLLREALKGHFSQQGFVFSADELVINNGCLDAIKIALEVISKPGDSIVVASPCFNGLLSLLASMDRRVIEIPNNEKGLDLKQVEYLMKNSLISACLLTANHQNPLGRSLSNGQKRKLAELSNQFLIPIVEDDVYQELHFSGALPLPIKHFDQKGTVIWCSSISKTLASGYRIGWVLAGRYFSDFLHKRTVQSLGVNQPLQYAVATFITNKYYQRHVRHIRHQLEKQCVAYKKILQKELSMIKNFYVSEPSGGLVLWVYVKGLDSEKLLINSKESNIIFKIGNEFSSRNLYNEYFRINFGYTLTEELTNQMLAICKMVRQQLKIDIKKGA